MATFSRVLLSGSTNGRPIPVAATASPGTTIHTVSATSGVLDEVYIYASNVTGTAATLTLEWGSTSDPAGHLVKAYSIAANSAPQTITLGQTLAASEVVRAFSGTASALNISGFVNRISP